MDILNTLLEITVYSGIIFFVTMLLKKLCKNSMSPWLHYAVWFVLVVRLMLPVTLESTFHVFSLPAQTQIETASMAQPEALAPAAATSAADTASDAQAKTVNPVEPSDKTVSPAPASASAKAASLSTQDFLLIVWLSGVGVCLMYLATLYTALRRSVRRNAAPPSQRLMALFEQTKAELDIRASIKLICQYKYGTPALMLPRTILMPVDTLVAMNDEQVKFALRHELMHYKHRDHLMCLLLSVLNAVHWFNPFVWLAFRQMRSDMEVKCDGAVVKRLTAAQKSRYASLIVSLFSQPQRRQLVLGMAQGDVKKVAEQRIRGVFMDTKSRRSARLVSALIAMLLAVTCFTTACQPTPEEPVIAKKDALEQSIESLPVQSESYHPPEVWQEELTDDATGNIVKVDAVISCPTYEGVDIMEIRPKNFTQDEVDALVNYFVENQTLYNGTFIETKKDVEDKIVDTQWLTTLTQERRDAEFGGLTDEDLQQQLEDLQERYDKAPEKAEQESVSTTLTKDKDGYEVLETYVDNGGSDDVLIDVYNLAEETNDASFHICVRDASAGGSIFPSDGTPEQTAQKIFDDLQISSVRLRESGNAAASNDPDNRKTVTRLFYELCINGLPFRDICSFVDDINIDYAAPMWHSGLICIDIGDNGPTNFSWNGHGEISKAIKEDVALMPFEDIQKEFRKNIFLQSIWPTSDQIKQGAEICPVVITGIDLCMVAIPQKNTLGEYLLTPAWNFYGYMDYPDEFGMYKDPSDRRFSLITISAVDGSLLHR